MKIIPSNTFNTLMSNNKNGVKRICRVKESGVDLFSVISYIRVQSGKLHNFCLSGFLRMYNTKRVKERIYSLPVRLTTAIRCQ